MRRIQHLIGSFVIVFTFVGCSAPHYNAHADTSSGATGGTGGDLRMSGVSGAGAMVGFLSLFAGCPRRATDDAVLARYTQDSDLEDSAPKLVRAQFFFHRARELADGVVFREGDHGETVVSLYCDDLVPEWVRVMQSRRASTDNPGFRKEVREVDGDSSAYDLSAASDEIAIVYQDGRQIRRVVLAMDDGDLSIKDK